MVKDGRDLTDHRGVHSVCAPFLLEGGVELPTKFSENGWRVGQYLNF